MNDTLQTTDWKHLPLRDAYKFGFENQLESEISDIKEMEIEWDRSYTSTVRRGFVIDLFERHTVLQSFKDIYWSNGNTPEGYRFIRHYKNIKQQYEDFLEGRSSDGATEDEPEPGGEFAYESDLRDFLSKNLGIVESGLELFQDKEKNGIEYPVEGGRIDILAKDRSGRFVAIELKVSRGRNRTIGQLAYYMGRLDKIFLGAAKSRGIIVAKEISDDLLLACERVPDVSLFEYALKVDLKRVFPSS